MAGGAGLRGAERSVRGRASRIHERERQRVHRAAGARPGRWIGRVREPRGGHAVNRPRLRRPARGQALVETSLLLATLVGALAVGGLWLVRAHPPVLPEVGRAPGRGREEISVGGGSLKKK